jgi:hypothetical protein
MFILAPLLAVELTDFLFLDDSRNCQVTGSDTLQNSIFEPYHIP